MLKLHRTIYFLLALLITQPSIAQQEVFPFKGKLIIIGGGDILDTMYNLFAKEIGGKDQPIVYIPTATDDEPWIQEGQHLVKFTSRGFTNLSTVHTRDKQKANELFDLMYKFADYGFTPETYAQAESYAFMKDFIGRSGVNKFFHFNVIKSK